MNETDPSNTKGYNRILDLVLLYAEMEAQHQVNNPGVRIDSPEALVLKASRYENILVGYRNMKGLTRDEKDARRFVRNELRRTKAQLNPTLLNRVRAISLRELVERVVIGKDSNRSLHYRFIGRVEKKILTDHQVAALMSQMKAAGFKDHLDGALKQFLEHSSQPAFNLRYHDVQKPDADYLLHFKKLPGMDIFYFEKYDVTIRPDLQDLLRQTPTSQKVTVSMTSGIALNAEESRRLAADRAIQKTIDGIQSWLVRGPTDIQVLDFNLAAALQRWPIKEFMQKDGASAELAKGLSAGKQMEVTLATANGEQKIQVTIGPSPDGHSLQLYFRNDQGKVVDAQRIVDGKTPQQTAARVMQSLAQKNAQAALGRLFKVR